MVLSLSFEAFIFLYVFEMKLYVKILKKVKEILKANKHFEMRNV